MSAAHQRQLETLTTVLNLPVLATSSAHLRLRSSQNGSRGVTKGALRAMAGAKAGQRKAGWVAGKLFEKHLRAAAEFHVVRMVRIGPGELDDDNLTAAFKAVRDGCAMALGVNDRDPKVRYVVDQERGPYGVRLELYASSVTREVLTDFGPPSEFCGPGSAAWDGHERAKSIAKRAIANVRRPR